MNETLKNIKERCSNRGYEPTRLSKETIQLLLDAALQAPTAANRQEIHISVFDGNSQILKDIEEKRREIAIASTDDEVKKQGIRNNPTNFYYDAPTVFMISCATGFSFAQFDAGVCAQNICLAAQSLGLGNIHLGIIKPVFLGENGESFKKRCAFPENYEFAIAVAVGYATKSKEPHTYDQARQVTFIED